MSPLWPLPIGDVKSIILEVRSSVLPFPASSFNGSSGNSGVRFSKRILFLDSPGSVKFILSTFSNAK